MSEKPLILVIDDEESVQRYAVDALQSCGYAAVGVTAPRTALDLIRNLPSLQVVLSDIDLGPVTGPDLIRQALHDRPDLKVVFMTGGSHVVGVRRTDPILAKPFVLEELCATIEAVLQRPISERPTPKLERRRFSAS
jgi:DNA-binding NtrC family response regulator